MMLNKLKKLLIIQEDDAYFLFETLQVIEKNIAILKEFEIHILVDEKALSTLQETIDPIISGITTDSEKILNTEFDISFNLSHNTKSLSCHTQVKAKNKVGPYFEENRLIVPDLWSTYYLTLKGGAPFLTFHLQDIFRNILGVKRKAFEEKKPENFKIIAFGHFKSHLMTGDDLEVLIDKVHKHYPSLQIRDLSEIDLVSDLSRVLYVGPTCLNSLRICEGGATGLYLTSHFQGLNLLPYGPGHTYTSSRGKAYKTQDVFAMIERKLNHQPLYDNPAISIYGIDHENLYGAYVQSLNTSDDHYPIYQSHVVLWNFLLNLFESNLDITHCSTSQTNLIKANQVVLKKLLRIHDYAMSAVEKIHREAKNQSTSATNIEAHVKTLTEIDSVFEHIAASHSMLRPFLDFYKIRKGQNEGKTLLEQAQSTFIAYSEEHQSLTALDELFSVTLKRNEVNI